MYAPSKIFKSTNDRLYKSNFQQILFHSKWNMIMKNVFLGKKRTILKQKLKAKHNEITKTYVVYNITNPLFIEGIIYE